MMMSFNNAGLYTDTPGTLTPTLTKKETNISDLSLVLQSEIDENKKFFKELQEKETTSLTESEYYTAQSGFTTDSAASSSIWR